MNFIIVMTAKSLNFKPITTKRYKKEQYNVNNTAGTTKWSLHAGERNYENQMQELDSNISADSSCYCHFFNGIKAQ